LVVSKIQLHTSTECFALSCLKQQLAASPAADMKRQTKPVFGYYRRHKILMVKPLVQDSINSPVPLHHHHHHHHHDTCNLYINNKHNGSEGKLNEEC
jgi:hypothetical protein